MMDKFIGKMQWSRAIVLFSGALILSSLFLLGTGFTKVSGARSIRRTSRSLERERWSVILNSMSSGISEKYRSSWRKMAEERPDMMIRLVTTR